jgi:hypothetical protein
MAMPCSRLASVLRHATGREEPVKETIERHRRELRAEMKFSHERGDGSSVILP